jgi:DNA-binding FrmR family transcriptional regulator
MPVAATLGYGAILPLSIENLNTPETPPICGESGKLRSPAALDSDKRAEYTPMGNIEVAMAHTIHEKQKLLNRTRRLRGQVEAIERALDADAGCTAVLQLISAARGAINGLMAEVLEDHIRLHVVDPARSPSLEEIDAAEELIEIVHTYVT